MLTLFAGKWNFREWWKLVTQIIERGSWPMWVIVQINQRGSSELLCDNCPSLAVIAYVWYWYNCRKVQITYTAETPVTMRVSWARIYRLCNYIACPRSKHAHGKTHGSLIIVEKWLSLNCEGIRFWSSSDGDTYRWDGETKGDGDKGYFCYPLRGLPQWWLMKFRRK